MTCPKCDSDCIYVKDTMRGRDGKIYRRRHCADCGINFRTVEVILDDTDEARREYADAVENKSPLLKTVNTKRRDN